MTALKAFMMEQIYAIKKFVEDFCSGNVTPNNLKFTETLNKEIWYLRNKKFNKNLY